MIVVVEEGAYTDRMARVYDVPDEDVPAFVELCDSAENDVLMVAPHCMSVRPDDMAWVRDLSVIGAVEFPFRKKRWLGLSRPAVELFLRIVQRRIDNPSEFRCAGLATDWDSLVALAKARLAELDAAKP